MRVTQPVPTRRATIALAVLATMVLTLSACGSAAVASQPPPPTVAATPALAPTPALAATPPPTVAATPAPTATPAPDTMSTPTTVPAASPLPAAASRPQTIHLTLHPVNDTVGSLAGCAGAAGSCQGDFMVGYDPLVDAETGKEVGTYAYECFLVDVAGTLYHCPDTTITLSGRGQIVFTEVIEHEPGKPAAIAPITGGTGEFLGVTGTVTAKVLPGAGDFVISITR